MSAAGGLYLYAIVGQRPRGELGKGISGAALSVVRAGGAHVIVERTAPPETTARALRAHDRIVKRIASRASAVLPFRFGSVVASGVAVRQMLDPVAAVVASSLAAVDGCVQYTLRVYGHAGDAGAGDPGDPGDPGDAGDAGDAGEKRAARTKPARAGGGPGTRWLGERLRARRVPELAAVTEATAAYVRASRAERHDRPPLLASVYHLVPKAKVRAYRAALARATRELSRVDVRTSGPWPPYAFAELP